MHELGLCRSIAAVAERHAAGRAVRTVRVRVGALRQVGPGTLEYCWPLVTSGGVLAGSELVVEQVPVRVHCDACGHDADVGDELPLRCPRCGPAPVRVIAGEECLVTSLDVDEPDPVP